MTDNSYLTDNGIDPTCLDSGAYVLGALPPGEQATFLQHAQSCPQCQHEIGQFAGLLPLLAQHEPGHRWQADPPSGRASRRSAAVASIFPNRRRARRTTLTLVLLAAVLVTLATFVGLDRLTGPSTSATGGRPTATQSGQVGQQVVVRTFPDLGTATVEVTVVASTTGSSVSVLCSGAVRSAGHADATAALVSLWVRTHSGKLFEVTAWTDMQGSTTILGRTPVTPADIASFELRGSDGRTLSHIAA